VNDDLSHIVTLLLRLLRHRDRMSLMRSNLTILRVRLMLRLVLRRVPVSTDTVVTLLLDLVHLAVFEVWAGAEHPGDADEGDEEEDDLDEGLAGVELFFGGDLRVRR
jgi:hypothetical protein